MTITGKMQERIKAVAGELRRELYPETGYPEWGTKLDALEEEACEIGDAITRELLGQGLAAQAERACTAEVYVCSRCGGCTAEADCEPREIDTSRGPLAWPEPQRFCPACRQAFFPSVPRVGSRS
jgi:hypothetical protein